MAVSLSALCAGYALLPREIPGTHLLEAESASGP
jgi:hypothetical protein